MSIIVFVLALWSAPGPVNDPHPALIPPAHAITVAEVATHHQVDPVDVAGLLAAENRSRRYDPRTIGRYGAGGEEGLMQLVDAWKAEAVERCNAALRAEHHRYAGLADCVVLPADVRFEEVDLFDARVNLEVAAIAVAYMQAIHRERHPWLDHWQTIYRCHPRAWRSRAHGVSTQCQGSTWRAVAWTRQIGRQVEAVEATVDHAEAVLGCVVGVFGADVDATAQAQ